MGLIYLVKSVVVFSWTASTTVLSGYRLAECMYSKLVHYETTLCMQQLQLYCCIFVHVSRKGNC